MRTDVPADTRMMGVVHSALKRDLFRAREVLAAEPPPRGRQRVALGEHVSWMLDFLHGHHSGEDEGLWPLVRDRDPGAAELLDSMEADHARIAPAAEVAAIAASGYTATTTEAPRVALVGALDDLLGVLVPHLDREVAQAMPVVAASISDREWKDIEQRYFPQMQDQEVAMEHTTATVRRSPAGGLAPEMDESAARRVERWALVAGVTGCTANGLLLALFTVALPGNHDYDWTGPANDVIGAVAGLAMIPMSRGVRDLLGSPGRLPVLTRAVGVSAAALAVASGLLVTGRIEFPVQGVVGAGFAVTLLLWTGSAGRWAAVTGALPRRLARAARLIAAGGLAGLPLAAVGAALPRGSVAQYAVGGAGVGLVLAAYLAMPVWQILLSRTMSFRPVTGPVTAGLSS